jgi:hypothetical protein
MVRQAGLKKRGRNSRARAETKNGDEIQERGRKPRARAEIKSEGGNQGYAGKIRTNRGSKGRTSLCKRQQMFAISAIKPIFSK